MGNKLHKENGFRAPILKYFTGRDLGGWLGGSITLLSRGYKYPWGLTWQNLRDSELLNTLSIYIGLWSLRLDSIRNWRKHKGSRSAQVLKHHLSIYPSTHPLKDTIKSRSELLGVRRHGTESCPLEYAFWGKVQGEREVVSSVSYLKRQSQSR